MDMFTKEEAFSFLENNLKISDAEKKMQDDRKNLLDEFALKMQTELMFQNLRLLSKTPENRRRPTVEDIKADLLAGIGGLCYNMNVGSYFLLKALGFKAQLGLASVTSSVLSQNNHVLVYVSDVEIEGDKYLVEVGVGFPTYKAINLNFEAESPIYRDSFLEYKYIKLDNEILRMHRKGDLMKKGETSSREGINFVLDGWRRFYYAVPVGTNNLEEYDKPFDAVFTKPEITPFHQSFRVIGFPNKKAVMVVNNKTLIENDTGELEIKEIEGGDEGIIQSVRTHFPVIPEEMVRNAMKHWRQSIKSSAATTWGISS